MIMRKMFLLAAMVLLVSASVVFSQETEVVIFDQTLDSFRSTQFYSGTLDFNISGTYSSGDTISTTVGLQSFERFPVTDSYLVVQVIGGCREPVYPTSDGDCNLIYEKKVEGISMEPFGTKNVDVAYQLPKTLRAGTYRMDVYWKTRLTPIVGIVESFFVPKYRAFTVSNGGDFPGAEILWTKTSIGGGYSQSGAGTDPGSDVPGGVFVKSLGKDFSGRLSMKICEYDDTSCTSYLVDKSYDITVAAGGEKAVPVSFKAPSKPGAYAIRFELTDGGGNLHSLYRGRIVVMGETAKIMKLAASKLSFNPGEEGWVRVLVTGPMYPSDADTVARNVRLTTTVTDLGSGREVKTDTRTISRIGVDETTAEEVKFSPVSRLGNFKACAQLGSDSATYDSQCISTPTAAAVMPAIFGAESMYFLVPAIVLIFIAAYAIVKRRR